MRAAATQAATRLVHFKFPGINSGVSGFLLFSSVFSVLSLCPPNPEKALTQRIQRKEEKTGELDDVAGRFPY
jgi:hypothetical protein